jgi:hypothetical protein
MLSGLKVLPDEGDVFADDSSDTSSCCSDNTDIIDEAATPGYVAMFRAVTKVIVVPYALFFQHGIMLTPRVAKACLSRDSLVSTEASVISSATAGDAASVAERRSHTAEFDIPSTCPGLASS